EYKNINRLQNLKKRIERYEYVLAVRDVYALVNLKKRIESEDGRERLKHHFSLNLKKRIESG
ncbi:MAG: hypothetical protein N3F64_07820, partial [Nitrososphaeria archaeon]|nr:hypothetical protein [Nitrososphaeria archaeon]